MNVVVLAGRLSSDPQRRDLASGSVLWTLEVSTDTEHGVASVPVAWFDPSTAPAWSAGDEVYVVGEARRRFFRGATGTQSRTEVVAAEVLPVTQRARVRRSIDRLVARLGEGAPAALRST